ncbi:uncharacterized protein TrAtP1_002926 [Trichoderma atroviride]|uniref:uncharacterized protein n=1 Tax=Hypocrea atroviridis TaxID=63577 RepID=UPI0033210E6C|nr:hypothetical protein TrAtP1_002926 [Trichoderma atroviride]
MVKRKSNDSEPIPNKRAKLNHPTAAALDCQTLDLNTSHSTLLSPARLQKRKRTTHLPDESSTAKRAKRCSSDPDPLMLWPGLEEQPRSEGEVPHYDLTQTYFQQSKISTMRFLDEYRRYDRDSDHRNPLPSPDLSDDEVAQYATIESFSVRDATPPASAVLRSLREATPPRKKERAPRRRSNNRAENALLEKEQIFLRSKRSSRRDQGCSLWHLADDGKACPVVYT